MALRLSLRQLRLIRGFFTLTLVAGVALMLWPAAQRAYWALYNVRAAGEYDRAVAEVPDERLDAMWEAAAAYNAARGENVIGEPFIEGLNMDEDKLEYAALLDPMGSGVMGYVDVPRIGQRLNIYHGTDAPVLERGVGHLWGTSLPVGGASTHCVVSGHRGLASAKFFTDLDQMREGDLMYLRVLGRTLAYEVERVQVVLPTETQALAVEEGRDLLTLVTCTPYGVNTHRLLVTGHRVPYVPESDVAAGLGWLHGVRVALAGAIAVAILVLAVVLVRRRRRPEPSNPRHLRA